MTCVRYAIFLRLNTFSSSTATNMTDEAASTASSSFKVSGAVF